MYNPFKMVGLFNEVLQKGFRLKLGLVLCSCALRVIRVNWASHNPLMCLVSEVQSLAKIDSGPFKMKLERPESLSKENKEFD